MVYRYQFSATTQSTINGGVNAWNYVSVPSATTGTLYSSGLSQTLCSVSGTIYPISQAVPAGSTIVGVELHVAPYAGASAGLAVESVVRLVKGANRLANVARSTAIGTIDQFVVFGSPTELWGQTWATTDFSSINWEYQLTTSGAGNWYVDGVEVWFYTPGPPIYISVSPLGETDELRDKQIGAEGARINEVLPLAFGASPQPANELTPRYKGMKDTAMDGYFQCAASGLWFPLSMRRFDRRGAVGAPFVADAYPE